MLVREQGCARGEKHGQCSHHQGGVAHRGQFQSEKLQQELHRNAEEACDGEQPPFMCRKTRPSQNEEHARTREKEAVEHKMPHPELREGNFAEEEAHAPETSGQSTGCIARRVSRGGVTTRHQLKDGSALRKLTCVPTTAKSFNQHNARIHSATENVGFGALVCQGDALRRYDFEICD